MRLKLQIYFLISVGTRPPKPAQFEPFAIELITTTRSEVVKGKLKVETGIEANKLKTEVNVDIKAIKQAKEAISSKLKGESRKLKVKTKQSHPGEGKNVVYVPH